MPLMTPQQLLDDLTALRTDVVAGAVVPDRSTSPIDPIHRAGADNLGHYVSLRSNDLRPLQAALSAHGLSSLGRSEGNVLEAIDAVIVAARALAATRESAAPVPTPSNGSSLLERNTAALLGAVPAPRRTRIMVTMPSEAAHDPAVALALVQAGTDVARINTAHGDASEWRSIAANIRAAAASAQRPVRVLMDLAGPKLRTGPMASQPPVVRLRPERDSLGRVTAAATAVLVGSGAALTPGAVPVDRAFLHELRVGDAIELRDARGARRELVVSSLLGSSAGVMVMATRTTYITNGIELHVRHGARTKVVDLPPAPGWVMLHVNDIVVLDDDGEVSSETDGVRRISCTLPEAVHALSPGHRVFFDDGKFGAEVLTSDGHRATLRVTDAPPGGGRLRAEKGINLPDTRIDTPSLTAKDREDLVHVAEIADVVAMSFVRTADDVGQLLDALEELDAGHLGAVLKIETGDAFRNLPDLLRAVMRRPAAGVMIARGDLAVEAGYERLAELQEEILWLCEAAHLPVIWATQVLDTLARTGRPSRSEVTDAAAAERAECVMLNKGPFIVDAVRVLDDILRRMQGHQLKKRQLLRQLRSWS